MAEREWIGIVLSALGDHIRSLEDRNRDLKYLNESHEAFRDFDRDQIRKLGEEIEHKLDGSMTEQLAIDNNALIDLCRQWTSWAGQAQAFRKDVMTVLHQTGFDRKADMNAIAQFNTRVRDGAYDVIPLPTPSEGEPDAPKTYAGSFVRLGDAANAAVAGVGVHAPDESEHRTGEPGQGD